MALRSQNTMAESLQKMLGDVADMKVLPDADLQFLIELETVILQKLRAPIDDIMGQSGGQPQMGGAVPGSGAPNMPMERVAGIRNEAPMPNMDEFMRSMGGARG